MAKTLVIASHEPGPAVNGHDGCFARGGNNGICPGIQTAEWLNGMGDDEEQYIKWESGKIGVTNGDVRMNWIRGNSHVTAVDKRLAELHAEERRTAANLRYVRRELRRIKKASEENV